MPETRKKIQTKNPRNKLVFSFKPSNNNGHHAVKVLCLNAGWGKKTETPRATKSCHFAMTPDFLVLNKRAACSGDLAHKQEEPTPITSESKKESRTMTVAALPMSGVFSVQTVAESEGVPEQDEDSTQSQIQAESMLSLVSSVKLARLE